MKKKTVKKLVLAKETLQSLDKQDHLKQVLGGIRTQDFKTCMQAEN